LAEDLLEVEPINPNEPVRVPGFRGAKRREAFISSGTIEINDKDWDKFISAFDKL
jgi:LDH2 family malate/lactate/ureidoglycolate dehydrogenase